MIKHTNTGSVILIDLDTITDGRHAEPLVREVMKYSAFISDGDYFAVVALDDHEGISACQQAGCQVIIVDRLSGRTKTVRQLVRRLTRQISASPPLMLLVVSNDPELADLCDDAVQAGVPTVSVLGSGETPHPQLLRFNYRPVELLVPEYQQHLIHAYIDYENWHFHYKQAGQEIHPEQLLAMFEQSLKQEGRVVGWWAYGDWGLMQREAKCDIQRELTRLGVTTVYQLNMRGKNSADMKIADDLRTRMESRDRFGATVLKYALCTNDRDFRPIAETAKAGGRELILVARQDGLAQELRQVANKICYVDAGLPRPNHEARPLNRPVVDRDLAVLVMRIDAWLTANGWKWVFADRLVTRLREMGVSAEHLHRAIEAGVIVQAPRAVRNPDGSERQANTYALKADHPAVEAARFIARWLPAQCKIFLQERGMPYIDTAFLGRGMQMNHRCRELGIGQNHENAVFWLDVASAAGVAVSRRQTHPKNDGRMITTWWLPATTHDETRPAAAEEQQSREAPSQVPAGTLEAPGVSENAVESAAIRQMVTEALDDEQLRILTYDHFRDVYERIGTGMTKGSVVQLLVEHVERVKQVPQLIHSLQAINPNGMRRYYGQQAA